MNDTFEANQTSEQSRGNFSDEPDYPNDADEPFKHWHVYIEIAFIGVICSLGILGNIFAIRSTSVMLKSSKQNSIIGFSLRASDFFICFIRGPSLIFIFFQQFNGRIVCEIWMFSTVFVIISILTNMVIAIERYMIVNTFQLYVKLFTPKHVVILLVVLWVGIVSTFTTVYFGFGYETTLLVDKYSCVLRSRFGFMTSWSSFFVCLVGVAIFGFVPTVILIFCYVSIVYNICKAGLLKLDKIEEKVNYTRVTYVSCARAFLMVVCWTPFLIFVLLISLYSDTLVSNMRYVDYIVIIQSAVCPFLTMQDSDFKETFTRRKSRYLPMFLSAKREVKPMRQSNISSADMKTM